MPEHEIRTVTTLTAKRDEILRVIAGYETKLAQARADLAAVSAAIVVLERREAFEARPYDDLSHLFRYGELGSLCLAALSDGPLSTLAVAAKVAAAKGFDTDDKVLLKSLCYSVVASLRSMEQRRKVRDGGSFHPSGRRKRSRFWMLPKSP